MKSPLHPSNEEAVDTIDAMMFSGDITETREKFDYIKEMVARWSRRISEAEKNPTYLMPKED